MKKNVLVIIADQLRKDTLGCYGNSVVKTPNIDRLAEEGARFNRCYVANPVCMPKRVSIFTGMYPRNHGLWTNGLLLRHEQATLPLELSRMGYQTASFGKVHFEPMAAPGDSGSRESREYWENKDCIEPLRSYWGFEHVELTFHTGKASQAVVTWISLKAVLINEERLLT